MKNALVSLLLFVSVACFAADLKPCPGEVPKNPKKVTLVDYDGLNCILSDGKTGVVKLYWPKGLFATSGDVEIKPEEVHVRLDPNGKYTLLLADNRFSIRQGQDFRMVLHLKVDGAKRINPWIHGCEAAKDGAVDATQSIRPTADEIVHGYHGTIATASCREGTDEEPQSRQAFAGGLHESEVIVHLSGGKVGAAQMTSVGLHFHP